MTEKKHGLAGRPGNRTLPSNEKRQAYLHIRCLEVDKVRWKQIAESKNMTLSEWLINLANKQKNNKYISKCVDV